VNYPGTCDNMELIGGTFSLNRVRSADEHASLVRVLRMSIYVLLSLLLEQHFLSSSSVELHYPKPPPPPVKLPSPTATISHRNSSPDVQIEVRQRKRDLLRQGIWSLIHKRFPRSMTINTGTPETRSLDLLHNEPDGPRTPRGSLDASSVPAPRQRRFSIFGESRTPPSSPVAPPEPSPDRSFQTALRRIEEGKSLLSASTGLIIPTPQLLVRLAESEKESPALRMTGEERTGLSSILGWEGKKAATRGNLTGTAGFLRQQQLSLLYSEHVVQGTDRTPQVSADGTLSRPAETVSKPQANVYCGARVRWVTYVYYAGGDHDQTLGDVITLMSVGANEACTQPGCRALQRQHERRWIHGGICVAAKMETQTSSASSDTHSEEIEMWQGCKICGESTARCKMSDGT
jgi:1-phosphatidylinositol-3-phosphate 5-kinase